MTVIFIRASDEVRDVCLSEASNWINEPNQNQFKNMSGSLHQRYAVAAVAEYLANKKGFTLYDSNATYPKGQNNG